MLKKSLFYTAIVLSVLGFALPQESNAEDCSSFFNRCLTEKNFRCGSHDNAGERRCGKIVQLKGAQGYEPKELLELCEDHCESRQNKPAGCTGNCK